MPKKMQPPAPAVAPRRGYTIQKQEKSRFWEVIDPFGELVCLTVYKRGAVEVVRRLSR
ncbi:MAG TPA: hypothetical protein VGX50_12470 [Longimicrobium sp.]|jgi:hypothetical protein|nr:hypothetical protein [Longimicrobium sp.]